MKIFAPNYYNSFKCINKNCMHNCCIGWEIDIDNNTYNRYKNIKGEFGQKLEKSISFDGEIASFILLNNEKCPFLNNDNLCEIIINLGEDALCQICNDHPRFRNFYSNYTEIGIGLCCEEAGRIIINQQEPFYLVTTEETDEYESIIDIESEFFEIRNNIFNIINADGKLEDKINNILNQFNISFPKKSLTEWIEIYLALEILDISWNKLLKKLSTVDSSKMQLPHQFDKSFSNILTYFIYRHLGKSIYDGNFKGRLLFSILSCYIIYAVCYSKFNSKITLEDIIEISRMYSSEIEYSDKNANIIIELLQTESLG